MTLTFEESVEFWEALALVDPYWSIFPRSEKGSWEDRLDHFYDTGVTQVHNMMRPMSRHLTNGTALDFGCGVGRTTRPLHRYYNNVIGYDSSPSMIKVAKENTVEENVSYTVGTYDDIPRESVEFLLSVVTLQHIPSKWLLTVINRLLGALKPGGFAVFQIPDSETDRDSKTPLMDFSITCTPVETVIPVVKHAGCFVMRIEKDMMLGMHWHNYTYYIGKGPGYTTSFHGCWD